MSISISPSSASPRPISPPDAAEALKRVWRRGLTPPPPLNCVEWAETFRRLSRESSLGGRFVVSRVEVARGPMLAPTEPGVQVITLMACTQLLKTTLIENVLGRAIHLDPGPILVIEPNDNAAEAFSKDRLAPMIRDTKVLRDIFGKGKSRDAGNTLTHKQFPGGHVTIVGAGSPTNLAMRPIRIVLADEIDKYPPSAGAEGDPVMLAEERQAEFTANKLSIRACSPTIEGRSAIAASYDESDQRKPYVACPHCSHQQVLEWERVVWEKDRRGRVRTETVGYLCEGDGCGVLWSEADRLRALATIWWRQTRVFDCCGRNQKPERWAVDGFALCGVCDRRAVSNEHAGFWVSKLYAPKQSLVDLVRKFERARNRGPEALKTFTNTQLARTWKEAAEAPDWSGVYDRRDSYKSGTVPLSVLFLEAGVDVQKDRLEVSTWGFGRGRQRWLIEHRVLPGETNRPQVWQALAAMFDETWAHESGREIGVDHWGIDSSGYTADVYAFVRAQRGRGNVFAIDGQDSYEAAFLGVGGKDVDAKGKKLRRGLKTVKVGVSFCKREMIVQLTLPRPAAGEDYPVGFVHLPNDVSEETVKQLTSEELQTKVVRGRTRRSWSIIEGRRNEALDCANYARGLAAMRGWDRMREHHFVSFEKLLGVKAIERPPAPLPADQQDGAPPPAAEPQAKPKRPARRVIRSSYMS